MSDKVKRAPENPARKSSPEIVARAWPEPAVPVRNPRYEGATPQQVALALLRVQPDAPKDVGKDRPSED